MESINDVTEGILVSFSACELLQKGVVAIFGPTSTFTTQHVQSICSRFGIPHIIYNWGYQQDSETYSANLHPDFRFFGKAIYDYLKSVTQKEVLAIIYEEEESESMASFLASVFAEMSNYY